MEKHVKGTMVIMIVKAIRANKKEHFEHLLTEKDKELVSQHILSASWYPFDTYKNCFNALAEVLTKGNMDLCRQWGKIQGERTMETFYQQAIIKGNIKKALEKFMRFFKLMYDFGNFSVEYPSNNQAIIIFNDFDRDFKIFYHVAQGWVERYFELCGCNDVESKFIAKSWEGAEESKIQISWN